MTDSKEKQAAQHADAQAEEATKAQENSAQEAAEQADQALEEAENQADQDMQALLDSAREEAEKHKELAMRVQADMENLRRRTRLDVESAHKYALDKFVNALLPAIDSMEMGMAAAKKEEASVESISEGVEMTFKQLLDVLQEFNVERIDPTGEKFDPNLHEAMTMIPSEEHDSNVVVETIQKGYTLNDRLVRAARVLVAQ